MCLATTAYINTYYFLVLVVIPPGLEFYEVTHSYSSRPFLCTLGKQYSTIVSLNSSSSLLSMLQASISCKMPHCLVAGVSVCHAEDTGGVCDCRRNI